MGWPQFGQAGAWFDTLWPQAGQSIRATMGTLFLSSFASFSEMIVNTVFLLVSGLRSFSSV